MSFGFLNIDVALQLSNNILFKEHFRDVLRMSIYFNFKAPFSEIAHVISENGECDRQRWSLSLDHLIHI